MIVVGWLVGAEVERLGDGQPVKEMYGAGYADKNEAIAAVKKHVRGVGGNVTIFRAVETVPSGTIGIEAGQVRQIFVVR